MKFILLCMILLSRIALCQTPYTGTTTVFIPYSNAASNPTLQNSPSIYVAFNGDSRRIPFTMDTGSVGIVASTDNFKPARGAKNLGSGQQIYSSSGIIEQGTWWSATQEFYDGEGNLLATANVPVLQVTSQACQAMARSCNPPPPVPTGVALMGIGFAREGPEQPRGTPEYNAFLNIQKVLQNGVLSPLPSDWCNGYVVTAHGVYLGLTASNTANAGFVKLAPWTQYSTPTLQEWMPAPMTVVINGVAGNGNVLMDTGVGDGFLTPPTNAVMSSPVSCPSNPMLDECVACNNTFQLYFTDQANAVCSYSFTNCDTSNLMTPSEIHLVSGSSIFMNTSRVVLNGLSFLYDNTNGYAGYIQTAAPTQVTPATTASTTTLASSANPAWPSATVTFTATATGVGTAQIPTGAVTFFIDGTPQYVPVNNQGVATYSTQLTRGNHTISASYSGDGTFIRSNSSPLSQYVGRN